MRSLVYLVLLAGLISSCAPSGEAARTRLDQLLDLAKANRCEDIAPMVVYAGRNMDRSYKDTYHASYPADMEYISKLCNSIGTTLSGATDIRYAKFSSKFKTGTQRDIWEIWVAKPSGTFKYFYDFVKLDTTLYLIETY